MRAVVVFNGRRMTGPDQPERGPGPELGDYLGLPITDDARLHADSWDASRLTLQLVATTVAYAQPRLGGTIDFRSVRVELPTVTAVTG